MDKYNKVLLIVCGGKTYEKEFYREEEYDMTQLKNMYKKGYRYCSKCGRRTLQLRCDGDGNFQHPNIPTRGKAKHSQTNKKNREEDGNVWRCD